MIRSRLSLLALLLGVLGLVGCTAYQPVPLYQLSGGEVGVPQQAEGLALVLGPVSVADYLQREALLQRQPDGSLVATTDASWAGNLAADIDQQILRQLAWRLDSQRLVLAPAPSGFVPQLQVLLSITRLDSGPQHPAVLEAQWRVLDKAGQLRASRLVRIEEPHQAAIADQVRAQSVVLQRLVEQLAQAIVPLASSVVAEVPVKPAPARPRQRATPPSQAPLAEPVRNNLEVFRF
ncbi:MAG: ABC-type transport auxiliary lipoprotein family protein [Pseudomonas sp.]|uniref:PqiC family protein n=1 Tax=Pseudomonas sp. TaxID=306 RepID=UPI003397C0CE